ncbi:hypothetical protein JHN59_07980 [Streptomyces sp. MBT49]|uniref:hypothetical protein n=1 Tax=Streptomyces sp. MBT49 TaxID=1488380 RepID=UPI00190935A1|nr:hypothetical protein [Streptomyces sp. MBT49]MBK3624788.1 hypothetical protein [Streptomyces sp. MBT49]
MTTYRPLPCRSRTLAVLYGLASAGLIICATISSINNAPWYTLGFCGAASLFVIAILRETQALDSAYAVRTHMPATARQDAEAYACTVQQHSSGPGQLAEQRDPLAKRHTVNTITSDALDVLYERLRTTESRGSHRASIPSSIRCRAWKVSGWRVIRCSRKTAHVLSNGWHCHEPTGRVWPVSESDWSSAITRLPDPELPPAS